MDVSERAMCHNILKNARKWKDSCKNYSHKLYANVHYDE